MSKNTNHVIKGSCYGLTYKLNAVSNGIAFMEITNVERSKTKQVYQAYSTLCPGTPRHELLGSCITVGAFVIAKEYNLDCDSVWVMMQTTDYLCFASDVQCRDTVPEDMTYTPHVVFSTLNGRVFASAFVGSIENYDKFSRMIRAMETTLSAENNYKLYVPCWDHDGRNFFPNKKDFGLICAIAEFFYEKFNQVAEDSLPSTIAPLKELAGQASIMVMTAFFTAICDTECSKSIQHQDCETFNKNFAQFYSTDILDALCECVKVDLINQERTSLNVYFDSIDCESMGVEYGSKDFCKLIAIAGLNKVRCWKS